MGLIVVDHNSLQVIVGIQQDSGALGCALTVKQYYIMCCALG